MSVPVTPRGPRLPSGPRAGSGHRGPAGPRSARRAGGQRREARELEAIDPAAAYPEVIPAAAVLEPPSTLQPAAALEPPVTLEPPVSLESPVALGPPVALEPPAVADREAPAPPEQPASTGYMFRQDHRSALQRLMDQLDDLLRDPTLTIVLKKLRDKLATGLRDLAAAISQAVKRLSQLRLRLPRRMLLGLLALLLPLALLALLTGGDDDRSTPSRAAAPPAAQPVGGAAGGSLPSVAMPALLAAQARPKPVRVALVVDRTYDAARLQRELGTLGAWLAAHHAAGTRVTIIDAQSATSTAPLRAGELAAGEPQSPRASTTEAIRAALGDPGDRRLLVTLGSRAPAVGNPRTLSITTRRDGTPSAAPTIGRRSRAVIDDRRPNTLAASVARAIMAASGQSERR